MKLNHANAQLLVQIAMQQKRAAALWPMGQQRSVSHNYASARAAYVELFGSAVDQ